MNPLREFPAYARLPQRLLHAEGSALHLEALPPVADFYGGHCVNTLGAGDAAIGAALAEQWRTLSFATNLFEHDGRARFLDAWRPLLPPGEWQVFASNSGAEANENLLKGALAVSGRDCVVCFDGAFHGRTAAADAVSAADARPAAAEGFQTAAHRPAGAFPRTPFEVRRLPWGEVSAIDDRVAAVILEPIQSLAGVIEPPPGFLQALRRQCDAHQCLLLFDEVQSGNGRLGTPWAAQHYGVTADAFSTAKGVAAGVPLGLSFFRAEIAQAFPAGLFGSTFGGCPLSLAASTVVAQRLADGNLLSQVRARSAALKQLAGHGPVTRVRGAGLLLGLELSGEVSARGVQQRLLAQGILTGTCRDPQVLRLCPPLTLPPADIERLADALAQLEALQ